MERYCSCNHLYALSGLISASDTLQRIALLQHDGGDPEVRIHLLVSMCVTSGLRPLCKLQDASGRASPVRALWFVALGTDMFMM